MLDGYLQQVLNLYDKADGILMTDKEGVVEYSRFAIGNDRLLSQPVIGMHILEIYPELTEDTSDIVQVLKTGKPITSNEQKLTDYNGRSIHIFSTTYPIETKGEVIGALNVTKHIRDLKKQVEGVTKTKTLYSLNDIVTQDEHLMSIKEKIRRISANNSSVLITGETGTGKELFAQSIHALSSRSNGPFVSQNCAAIPENLLEGLFFGTEKGSFTGAEDKKGLFEISNGGTLFLDEINSMAYGIQSKILKVLEDKKVKPIGASEERRLDLRIVSAMNETPEEALRLKKIREDLFYRIGVVHLEIPPLRHRKGDILFLVEYFINQYNEEMDKSIIGVTELVKNTLQQYDWPGNVRELKNVIEAAFNVAMSDKITMQDIPHYIMKKKIVKNNYFETIKESSLPNLMMNYEKSIIEMAIEDSANLMEAADMLKISRQSLQYKLQKYGMIQKEIASDRQKFLILKKICLFFLI